MRKSVFGLLFIASLAIASPTYAAGCTPTGFFRDSINMTAALINPTGTVSGNVDATGCNIAVYVDGGHDLKMVGADVFGSNYFGVLVNTDNAGASSVMIRGSNVHHIGENPHNGTQHGVAIYLRGFAGSITGKIDSDYIFDYQKGGIVANGPGTDVDITGNTVIGDGHVTFIAQNGIQMAFGASSSTIAGNSVYGNSYIGNPGDGSSSAGILIVGGAGVGTCPPVNADCGYDTNIIVRDNWLSANDTGIYVFNGDADGNPPATPTNVSMINNRVYGDLCYNQSYQAGIFDEGNHDKIVANSVWGPGYTSCATGTAIDTTDSTDPKVHNNTDHPRRVPHPYGDRDDRW